MLQKFFKKYIGKETDINHLALAFSFGSYVAFSPFLCLHTAMVFLFGWLFRLNIPVALIASCAINNPWTMIPIYSADYAFGYLILHKLTNWGTYLVNPSWLSFLDIFCQKKLNMGPISLWAFLIGGNLLALLVGIIAYPLGYYMFKKLIAELHKKSE